MATLLERDQRAPSDVKRQVDLLLRQAADDRAWTDQLGTVCAQGQVAELLGKSEQAVSTDEGLLRLEMRDGGVGYPVFQFEGTGSCRGYRTSCEPCPPLPRRPGRSAPG